MKEFASPCRSECAECKCRCGQGPILKLEIKINKISDEFLLYFARNLACPEYIA
jgi:hypothetical protein